MEAYDILYCNSKKEKTNNDNLFVGNDESFV